VLSVAVLATVDSPTSDAAAGVAAATIVHSAAAVALLMLLGCSYCYGSSVMCIVAQHRPITLQTTAATAIADVPQER
jgi:hypothetical protein